LLYTCLIWLWLQKLIDKLESFFFKHQIAILIP